MTSKEKLLPLAVEGAEGRHWYRDALSDIEEGCREMGWDVPKFVAVLAATSPRVSVAQNVKLATLYMRGSPTLPCLPSVLASLRTLAEERYDVEGVNGPKTYRFAKALLGDPNAVVLDRHMGYALKVDPSQLKKPKIQEEAEKRIKWVANRLEWTPAETQAAIWAAQRKRIGYAYSGLSLVEHLNDIQDELD